MATNAVKYITNVGKSIMYSTVDHLKDANPALAGFKDTNEDILKASYDSITHIKRTSQNMAGKFMDSRYGQLVKNGLSNVKQDIASGNFYNRARIEKAENNAANAMLGDDDFDISFESDSSSYDDGMSLDSIDQVGQKTSTAISSIIAKTTEYAVETNLEIEKTKAKQSLLYFSKIHSGMGSINTNLSTLIKFATGPMQTHLDNSTNFYTAQTEMMQKQTKLLEELVQMQKEYMKPQKTSKSKSGKIGMYDILDSSGMPDLAMFGKRVKQNIKAMDSGMGDMIDFFFESGAMDAMIASPLQFITDGVAKQLIPKIVTQSMKSFNKSLSGLFPAMLSKLQNSESSNPIINWLKQAFDVSETVSKTMNTADYEKGRVPFDGITRKSIVEVIPTYLSKIYSALSGREEDRYNYDKGKFEKVSYIRKAFNDKYDNLYKNSSREIEDYIMEVAAEMNFDKGYEKQFKKDLQAILKKSYDSGMLFNPKNADAKMYGLKGGKKSDVSIEVLKQIFQQMPISMQMQWFTETANAKSRSASELRGSLTNTDSVFSALFNDSGDFATKVKKAVDKKEEEAKAKGLKKLLSKYKKDKDSVSEEEYEYILKKSVTTASPQGVMFNIYSEVKTIRELLESGHDDIGGLGRASSSTSKTGKVDLNSYLNNLTPEQYAAKAKLWEKYRQRTNAEYDQIAAISPEMVKEAIRLRDEKEKEDSFLDKILDDVHVPDSIRSIINNSRETKDIVTSPLKSLAFLFKKGEEVMYKLVFGTKESPEQDEDEKTGIFGTIQTGLKDTFSDFKIWMEDEIFAPLSRFLEKGVGRKILEKMGINVSEFVDKHKDKLIGEGAPLHDFGSRFTSQFKRAGIFAKDSISGVADALELTKKRNASGEAKHQYNNRVTNATRILRELGKAGIGEIENAASGMKKVSKTGIVAVSEGEMIVPADMNPFNMLKNFKNENKAKEKFMRVFGKMNIPTYAGGTEAVNKFLEDGDVESFKASLKGLTKDQIDTLMRFMKSKYKDYTTEDYEEGRDKGLLGKSIDVIFQSAKQAGETIKTRVNEAFPDKKKQEKESQGLLSTALKEMKKNIPEMAAGGAIGAGVSLLTGAIGGPLLGAAIGAGTTLFTRSEALQEALFGKEVVDDNGEKIRKGGIFKGETLNKLKKYVPSMTKGGIIGGLASLLPFIPGGPVAGIIAGSAIGFASKNDAVQKALFGDEETGKKGILPKDIMKRFKKALPKAGAGAIIGALTGPFGLVTNIAVGSAIGLATETNTFKDIMFGKDGEKGWVQKLLDETIGKLKDAVDPLKKQFELMAKGIGGFFKNTLDKILKAHLGSPLEKTVKAITDPIKSIFGGFLKGVLAPAKFVATLPFNVVGGLGNMARKHQISRGLDDYDSAQQRILFRKKRRRKKDILDPTARAYARYDERMVNMDATQIARTLDELRNVEKTSKEFESDEALDEYLEQFRENISRNSNLSNHQTNKIATGAYKALRGKKDPDDVARSLNNYIAGLNLDPEEREKISGSANTLIAAIRDRDGKRKSFNDSKNDLLKTLGKKYGLTVEDAEHIPNLIKLLERQQKEVGEASPTEQLNEDQKDRHEELIDHIKKIQEYLAKLANPDKENILNAKGEYDDMYTEADENGLGVKAKRWIRDTKGNVVGFLNKAGQLVKLRKAALNESNRGIKNAIWGNKTINVNNPDEYDLETGEKIDPKTGEPITISQNAYSKAKAAVFNKKKTKARYVFTSDAQPVRYLEDKEGKYTIDKGDADTAKTLNKIEEKEEKQNTLWSKISGLPSTLGRIFGFNKDDVEGTNDNSNNEGFLSKFIKKASIAAGLLVGAPILTGIWTDDIWPKLKPILEPLGDKLKGAVGTLWTKFQGWLTGTPATTEDGSESPTDSTGYGYGLPGIINYLGEKWVSGADTIMEKLVPRAVELVVKSIPLILKGLGNGVEALLNTDANSITRATAESTKPDSVSYSQFNSDEYDKNSEELVGKRDTLGSNLLKTAGKSFIRGKTNTTILGKAGKALSKSPVFKTASKITGGIMQGADKVITGSGRLGDKILYGGAHAAETAAKEAATETAEAATKQPGKVATAFNTIKSKVSNVKNNLLTGGYDTVDVIMGATGAGADDVVTQTMTRTDAIAKGFTEAGDYVVTKQNKLGKLVTKADDAIKSVGSKAIKTLDDTASKGVLGKLINHCNTAISKLFSNETVINKFAQVGKAMGGMEKTAAKEVAEKFGQELAEKLTKYFGTKLASKIAAVTAKLAAGTLSVGIINIAFGVAAFLKGFNNANDILGVANTVEEPSFLVKLLAGIASAVNELCCLGLVPLSMIVDLALPLLNKIPAFKESTTELIEDREQSAEEVAEFNEKNKTNLTVQEYNKLLKTKKRSSGIASIIGQKAYVDENGEYHEAEDGALQKAGKSISKGTKKIWSTVKSGAKKGASEVKGFLFGDTDTEQTGLLPSLGNVGSAAWKWAIGKSDENASSVIESTMDKDDPIFSSMKIMAKVADILLTPLHSTVKTGKTIWEKSSGVFKTIGSIGQRIMTDTADGVSDLWKGDIKSFLTINKQNDDDENPLSPFRTILKGISRALLLPVSGIIYAGGRLKDGITTLVSGAKQSIGNVFTTEKQLIGDAFKGNLQISDIFTIKNENDGDGALKWVSTALRGVSRVVTGPVAAVGATGAFIKEKVSGIINGAKQSVGNVISSEKELISNSFKGNTTFSDIFTIKEESDGEGPLKWVSTALRGVSRVVTGPISLVGMAGSAIKEKVSGVVGGGKKAIEIIQTEASRLSKYKTKKNLDGYWDKATVVEEEGIIGTFAEVANSIMRAILFPTYLLRTIVNTIKGKIDDAVDGVKDAFGKFADWFLGGSDSLAEDSSKDYSGKGTGFRGKSFISQKDPSIANKKFGNETIGEAGCAPASAYMAAGSASGFENAVTMAKKYKNNDGVSASYFGDYFSSQGIPSTYTGGSSDIKAHLKNGSNVIIGGQDSSNMSKAISPFGPGGHYIVANGISKDGKYISVNDPEASAPNKIYPTSKVLSHAKVGIATRGKGSLLRFLNFKGKGFRGKAITLAGSTLQEQVWNYLKTRGFSDQSAAAVMGNIQQECSFNPTSVQDIPRSAGHGLFQWTNGRYDNLVKMASSMGVDWTDTGAQLEHFWNEFSSTETTWISRANKYCNGYTGFMALTDIDNATEIFCSHFERAGKPMLTKRQQYAKQFYNQFSGNYTPVSGIDSASSSNTSTTLLDKVLGVFDTLSAAYGLSSSTSTNATSTSTAGTDQQQALVNKMKSIEGTIAYSQSGTRNPDDGSADCSSTVQWAYKNVLGVDPGSWTGAQRTDSDTYTPFEGGVTESTVSLLQPGDLLLKNGHVEMYAGDRKMIGHGGPGLGPTTKDLNTTGTYDLVRRWTGFKGSGSGLGDSTIVRYAKGAANSTSHSVERSNNTQPGLSQSTKLVANQSKAIAKSSSLDIFANTNTSTTSNTQPGINYTAHLNTIINLLGNIVSNTALLEQMVTLLTSIVTIMSEEDQAKKDNNQEKLQQLKGKKNKLLSSLSSVSSKSNDEQIAALVKNAEKLARA